MGKDRLETTITGEHPERRTRRRARTLGCRHMGMSRHRRAFLVGAPRGASQGGESMKAEVGAGHEGWSECENYH